MRFWKATESESETTKSGRRIHRTKSIVRRKRINRSRKFKNGLKRAFLLSLAGSGLFALGAVRGQQHAENAQEKAWRRCEK
jgi:hypothetical protein